MKNYYLLLFILSSAISIHSQNKNELFVDSIFSAFDDTISPSISVLLVKDNITFIQKSYGYADIEQKYKANSDTKYNLGKLSNIIISAAILKLIDDKKLDYKDDLNKIFPDFPEYGKNVTIKHLLDQTSGLNSINFDSLKLITNSEIYNYLLQQKKLINKPGKKWSPNDCNYAILTLVIEKVTNKPYVKYLKKEVFKPIGINNIKVEKINKNIKIKNLAFGYNINYGRYELNNDNEWYQIKGNEGIFASSNDMLILYSLFCSDVIYDNKRRNEFYRMRFNPNYHTYSGQGWKVKFNNAQKYAFQSNNILGYSHLALIIPQENIYLVILSNQYPVFDLREKSFKIINKYFDKNYEIK